MPRMTTMSQSMSVLTSQSSQEWYTPGHVILWVRDILGDIELDPASCEEANKTVQAKQIYTLATRGYHTRWVADTLFLNPPFSETGKWVDKLTWRYIDGDVRQAIMLINSAPGYVWFESLWRERTVCMLRERLKFTSSDGLVYGQAKKGQALVYFGQDDTKFAEVLEPYGRVLRP